MADKNRIAVFGILATRHHVEVAVDALVEAGFPAADISVLLRQGLGTRDFALEKQARAPEGAGAGATTGGVPGGRLGLLVGMGTLTLPGLGPVLAAGPLRAGLAVTGTGGAPGGLLGALVRNGVAEWEAKRYESRVRIGGVLLSVHCDSHDAVLHATDVLEQTGAEDVDSAVEIDGIAQTGAFMQIQPRV